MAQSETGNQAGQARTDKPKTYPSKSKGPRTFKGAPDKFALFHHISNVKIDRRMGQDVETICRKLFPKNFSPN